MADIKQDSSLVCAQCGSPLALTDASFINDEWLPIGDVEHFECPSCGTRVLAGDQQEEYRAAVNQQRDYAQQRLERWLKEGLDLRM